MRMEAQAGGEIPLMQFLGLAAKMADHASTLALMHVKSEHKPTKANQTQDKPSVVKINVSHDVSPSIDVDDDRRRDVMGYVDLHNGWFVLSLVGFCGLVFALYMHESERRRMIRHLCREAEELHQWNLAASLRLHPHLSALAALPGSVKKVGDLLEELSKMMWRAPYLVVCSERFPTET